LVLVLLTGCSTSNVRPSQGDGAGIDDAAGPDGTLAGDAGQPPSDGDGPSDSGPRAPFVVSAVFETIEEPAPDGGYLAVGLLGPMHAAFVLRAFFKWGPLGAAWLASLHDAVDELRQALPPGAVLQGGITAAYLQTQSPDRWVDGGALSPSDYAAMLLKDDAGNPVPFPYDPDAGAVADLASPTFRAFLLQWAEQQIAAGMDSIFFDQVYYAAEYRVAHFHADPALVFPEYAGHWDELRTQLRSYATTLGRKVLIAQNGNEILAKGLFEIYPEMIRGDDILHGSFDPSDFTPNDAGSFFIVEDLPSIKKKLDAVMDGGVPVVYFIDWPQRLSQFGDLPPSQQVEVLASLDSASRDAGIFFAYPVYGGATTHGQYDSVAAGTYEAILGLAYKHAAPIRSRAPSQSR
jgi:hypothetical protein